MLNELRDTIPKLTITAPGNSMFYETAFPMRTPLRTEDDTSYENTDYFTRKLGLFQDQGKRISLAECFPVEESSGFTVEVWA